MQEKDHRRHRKPAVLECVEDVVIVINDETGCDHAAVGLKTGELGSYVRGDVSIDLLLDVARILAFGEVLASTNSSCSYEPKR